MFFSDIPGHNAIKNQVIINTNAGRVSHAQLWLGAQGSSAGPGPPL